MRTFIMLSETTTQAPPLNGVYLATGLGAPNATQRNLTLVLTGDSTAALIIEYIGKGTIIQRGNWTQRDTQAEILWTELDRETIALRMNFDLRGGELVYVGPDPNALGTIQVRLTRAGCNKQYQVTETVKVRNAEISPA